MKRLLLCFALILNFIFPIEAQEDDTSENFRQGEDVLDGEGIKKPDAKKNPLSDENLTDEIDDPETTEEEEWSAEEN